MNHKQKIIIAALVAVIGIAALVAVPVIFGYGPEEIEIFVLQGENGEMSVSVINEGSDIAVLLRDKDSSSVHFDVKLREYRSGGFSLKNSESGLAAFVHPTSKNNQYNVLILTSEDSKRFLAQKYIFQVEEYGQEEQLINKSKIEPSVKVGADISKWDIPTNTTRSADSRK